MKNGSRVGHADEDEKGSRKMTERDRQALLRVRSQARLVRELSERLEDAEAAAIPGRQMDGMPRGKAACPARAGNEADAERIAGKIAGAGRKAAARIRERSAGSDDWDEERRICLLLILLHLRDEFGGCDTDDGQMRKADSAIQAGD